MKIRQTTVTIKNVDLKKLMKQKGIKSLYQLSNVSGVNYSYLYNCAKGHVMMSEGTWDKIKQCL